MKKLNYKTLNIINRWLMPSVFMFMIFAASGLKAQTYSVEAFDAGAFYTSDPSVDLILEDSDPVQARIITVAGFATGDDFYLYYVPSFVPDPGNGLTEAMIIDSDVMAATAWTERNFSGVIGETGNFDVYVGAYNGRFDNSYFFDPDTITDYLGGVLGGAALADFYLSGNRYLISDVFDLSAETAGDVFLDVELDLNGVSAANFVAVEYSVNGGSTWTALEDGGAATEFSGFTQQVYTFELPAGAIAATTQFRVRQENSASLGTNAENFDVEDIELRKGTAISQIFSALVGTYNVVNAPPPPVASVAIGDVVDGLAASINAGNRALPGDVVTINTSTANIPDLANYEYFVQFAGEMYPIDAADVSVDQGNEIVDVDFTIPTDIPQYFNSNAATAEVLIVDGTTIDYGAGAFNENLVTYDYGLEEILVAGGMVMGTEIYFEGAGERSVTTPALSIGEDEESVLSLFVRRLSNPIPPTGNEIAVEFSTDGTTWNPIAEVELGGVDGVGNAGETFNFTGTELTGINTATTWFRVRQLNEGNGANVHTWAIDNFSLNVPGTGGNILAQSNTWNTWIGQPTFTIALADANMDPVYPGESVAIDLDNIDGEFPSYTVYQVYDENNIWIMTLDALDAAADFDILVPLVDGAFKTYTLRAEARQWSYSQSVNFTVQNVTLEITDVSFDYEDAGATFSIPDDDIEVTFNMNGYIRDGIGAAVMLDVWTPAGEWETFAMQEVTTDINTNQGGTINGTLPPYEYGANTDIRIYIENYPWTDELYNYNTKDVRFYAASNWSSDIAYYYLGGVLATDDLNPTDKISFNLYLTGEEEGEAFFTFYNWLNGQMTPVNEAGFQITPDMNGYVTHISNLADYINTDQPDIQSIPSALYVGVQYPDIMNGANLEVRGVRIIEPDTATVGVVSTNIDLIYPSITLSDLDGSYDYGQTIDMQYSTFGIEAADNATIAVVLEQGSVMHVLTESDALGDVDVTLEIPSSDSLASVGFANTGEGDAFTLKAYVYRNDIYDYLLVATLEEQFDLGTDADFIEIDGFGGSIFNQTGDRFATTRAIDFTDMPEPVTLSFTYDADIDLVNPQTLVKLQVSNDAGATFTTLDIPESVYTNRLPEWVSGSATYDVEIPSQYLGSATHFRWIQDVTSGGGSNWWDIWNIKVLSGESNLYEPLEYIPVSQSFDLFEPSDDIYADYNDLGAYEWTLIDETLDPDLFSPVINVGEEFTYAWTIKDMYIDENGDIDFAAVEGDGYIIWPDTTEFEFSIVLNDGVDDYDYTYTAVSDTGVFTFTISDTADIETALYDIDVRAVIYGGDTIAHAYPGWVDPLDKEQGLVDPMAVSNELIINEITREHLEIVLTDTTAINMDLADHDYYFGSEMSVSYEAFGPYDVDSTKIAIVLSGLDNDGNFVYVTLDSTAFTTAGTDTVLIPTSTELEMMDWDLNEDILVWALSYKPMEDGDVLMIDEMVHASLTDASADFYIVNDGNGDESLFFNGVEEVDGVFTKRIALTKNLATYVGAGAVYNDHRLTFSYTDWGGISPVTEQTIPKLQVSTDDGVTFTTVEYLFESGSYTADISQEWLDNASDVVFRWIQDYPAGDWSLSSISIVSGESNLTGDAFHNFVLDLMEMGIDYPDNFTNYELIVGDGEVDGLESPLTVGVESQLTWRVIDSTDVDNLWPEGTMFEFTMDVEDPVTEDDLVLGTLVDDSIFMVTLDDYVLTDIYSISVRALVGEIVQEGDEYEHTYPELYDPYTNPSTVKEVIAVNILGEDGLKLVLDSIPKTDPEMVIPEFNLEEEVTITYDLYGAWPATTEIAAALVQFDGAGDVLQRTVLHEVSTAGGSITVSMPSNLSLDEDFDYFELKLFAYEGDTIGFGETTEDVEFLETAGDSYSTNYYRFDLDGDRYALSDTMDLSTYAAANISFDYIAVGILENPNSLPMVLVTIDGVDFDTLMIDTLVSEFGDYGFLPANTSGWDPFNVEIPNEYLTETTQFMFMQSINRGDGADEWYLDNVEVRSESNLLSYSEELNDQEVDLIQADLDDYEWAIVKDADGFEPALYSGSTFQFTWDVMNDDDGEPVGVSYPAATEFGFYLVDYPEEDSLYMMNATLVTGTDSIWDVTLPEDIHRDNYDVIVSVMLDTANIVRVTDFDVADGVEEFDDGWRSPIGSVSIFNPALITELDSDEVLYAGDTIGFTVDVQNDLTTMNTSWYYNLIVTDQWGDDWLLASELGTADFDNVGIPAFLRGGRAFKTEASIGNPMGIVGEMIEGDDDIELIEGNQEFFDPSYDNFGLWGSEGDKELLKTVGLDLTEIASVKFDIWAYELELTASQKLSLDYSIDSGMTFTSVASYPDARFTEDDLGVVFPEKIDLPAEAQSEHTILRWKIQEYKQGFDLDNIFLVPATTEYTAAPMAARTENINVIEQRIDIVSTDMLAYCNDGTIEIGYEIRGGFGPDVVFTLHSTEGYPMMDDENITIEGVTHGSGTLTLNLADLDDLIAGSNVKFRFYTEDNSVEDYEFDFWNDYSDFGIEIIDEIPMTYIYADIYGWNSNITCEAEERVAIINNVVENFSYQLMDYETGTAIGDPVIIDTEDDDLMDSDTYPYYNPGLGRLEISLGTISEDVTVEVMVTAQTLSGDLVCGSAITDSQATFEVRPAYQLFVREGNGIWEPATDGQVFDICEGYTDLTFAMGYWKDGGFNTVAPEWFRDNLTRSLGTNTYYYEFDISGDYFAVFDGSCGEVTSVSVTVNVNTVPDQPIITVDGDSKLCGDETVTLSATTGYNHYQWRRDGSTFKAGNNESITVDTETISDDATFTVYVSNVPFEDGCSSVASDPVYIEEFEFNDVYFSSSNIYLCTSDEGIAEMQLNNMQEGVTYQLVDDATGAVFSAPFQSDGSSSVTFKTDTIKVDASYRIMATSNLDAACTNFFDDVTVNVYVLPEYQILAYNGTYYEVAGTGPYCEGTSLSVGEAIDDDGSFMGDVDWYFNGVKYADDDSYINAVETGEYYAMFRSWDGECSYTTDTVAIVANPERPVLTLSGDEVFCSGVGSATLSTDAGLDGYLWNGNGVQEEQMTENSVDVFESGSYSVRVVNASGCISGSSNEIDVTVLPLPYMGSDLSTMNNTLCGPGEAVIRVSDLGNGYYNDRVLTYQLVDMSTGQLVGSPESKLVSEGTEFVDLTSDEISESTEFGVMVFDEMVDGCDVMIDETITIDVNYAEVTAVGNILMATPGADAYRWFRNGQPILGNRGASSSIEVYDDAEYTVTITFDAGCILSLDLGSVKNLTGLSDYFSDNNVSVYPNPVQERLNIEIVNSYVGDVTIEVTNLAGQIIFNNEVHKHSEFMDMNLDMTNLPQGVYFINFITNDQSLVKSIVKQ